MKEGIVGREERISAQEYIVFLGRSDLGSQYPRERFQQRIRELVKYAHVLAGGEKDIAVYLIANEKAVPFYEKLGMKKAEDVMCDHRIEWTPFTVDPDEWEREEE